jgi:Haem-binding domain
MRIRRRRLLTRAGLGLLVVAVLLQLVPYGRDHTNPPVTQDAAWPDGRARELATAACYDCHSNQTRWPPQSYVAPFSWLLARDVEQGREALNFSTWDEDDGGPTTPPRRSPTAACRPAATCSSTPTPPSARPTGSSWSTPSRSWPTPAPAAATAAPAEASRASAVPRRPGRPGLSSGQGRGRKPARKALSTSWEAAQRSVGAWNRMAWRTPAALKVMS